MRMFSYRVFREIRAFYDYNSVIFSDLEWTVKIFHCESVLVLFKE